MRCPGGYADKRPGRQPEATLDRRRLAFHPWKSSGQASRMDRHTKRHQALGDGEFRKHQRSGAFIGQGVERNLITLTRPGLLSDQGPMP
jgi:hypothetical protein